MTMMSLNVVCDPTEVWVLQKVLAHYHVSAAVWPTDPPGPQVRLLVPATTTAQGHRMQAVLEGAQAALRALGFMGYLHVAEIVTSPAPCAQTRERRAHVDGRGAAG
jgi:hypothetical protein